MDIVYSVKLLAPFDLFIKYHNQQFKLERMGIMARKNIKNFFKF